MGSDPSRAQTKPQNSRKITNKPEFLEIRQQIQLRVATFDYGVCISPFEYVSAFSDPQRQAELEDLQRIFREEFKLVMNKQFTMGFRWNIGRLDRRLKKLRYSPLYSKSVGVVKNKFFMDLPEFTTTWNQKFQKLLTATHYETDPKTFEQQKQNLRTMDWIFFRTFVRYAYLPENKQTYSFESICEKQFPYKYVMYMNEKFSSKIINEDYKISKLIEKLDKYQVDILFLQQINNTILQRISSRSKNYRIAGKKGISSAILISWEAYYSMCGHDQNYPLEAYNTVHIHPQQALPPPMSFSNKHRDTKYYDDKFYSIKMSETESPMKLIQKKFDESSEQDNPQNNVEGQVVSILPYSDTSSIQAANMPQQQVHKQFFIPTLNQIITKKRLLAMNNTMKVLDDVDISNHYIPLSLIQKLNWDGQTYIQFLNQFILISGTIGNNNALNRVKSMTNQEIKKVREAFEELRAKFPQYKIIIGADVDVRDWKKLKGFHSFPNMRRLDTNVVTVHQKKTILQSQLQFAWEQYSVVGDYLLSSMPLRQGQIIDIKHNNVEGSPYLIPTEQHPYDHFLSTALIKTYKTVRKLKNS